MSSTTNRRHYRLAMGGLAAAIALIAPTQAFGASGPHAGCIPSGTETGINAALNGTGATAVLCPNAVFTINNPVVFTAPNQVLETQGLPTNNTRAILRLSSANLTTVVNGNSQSGVVVENIQVDGQRPKFGYLTGGALLEMGNAGSNQTIQNISAHDTRSWSTLHITEGAVTNNTPQCQNAKVLNNTLGPAGIDSPPGTWADGISLACGHSLVQGNLIQDPTDGGIVVFEAPGSMIKNNTIVALTKTLLGGINLVDFKPMNGNYTGTVITGNTINAQSAFIKVGIAMGPQSWGCPTGTNFGATVTNNLLEGTHFGYGYAINGVNNFTVTGNRDIATHRGTPHAGCGGLPSPPAGFQVQSATASTLQPQFTPAQIHYILAITP
jgi:hypothetical protein